MFDLPKFQFLSVTMCVCVCVCVCVRVRALAQSLSCVLLFVTPWTVACQAPLSMEFSRQEYWSGLLFPSPGDLPHPGIKPSSPVLQAGDALPLCYGGSISRAAIYFKERKRELQKASEIVSVSRVLSLSGC